MDSFTDEMPSETTADYIRRLITERNEAVRKLEQISEILAGRHDR